MLFITIFAQPQVSVIIPLYNHYQHINNSIQSILSQSYSNFNIIVVDDASTDGSSAIVQKLSADPRITLIQHKTTRGPFQARLTALSRTNATYVLFVDADDLLNNPNIIQLSVFQAEKYKADCVQFSELVSNLEWTKPQTCIVLRSHLKSVRK
ncbi:Glycosyl_transferase family 2 protein [Hexamita inflata]|uniref:Glycosyl transferase family 2 protein n=1 Tax=Hexamita inflata TaxID=28002 RepID=A0AA86U5T9_9EUKA|nr:Glycosyl transferase family 2 protein [Hexamita inflata]